MFPGSQPAGMVKQAAGDALRRVTPVYFFRLPLPADFSAGGPLLSSDGQSNQAVCRADAAGRFLYVVFYPEQEKAGERIVLRHAAGPAPSGWGGPVGDSQTSHPAGGDSLVAAGDGGVGLRITSRSKTRLPPGDSLWQLTYDASFHSRKSGARLRVSFPVDTRHAGSTKKIVCPDLEKKSLVAEHGAVRDLLVTTPKTGVFQLTARINIHLSGRPVWRDMPKVKLSTEALVRYQGDESGIQTSDPVVGRTLEHLRTGQGSNEEVVLQIFKYCHDHLVPGGDKDPQDALTALTKGVAGPLGKARAMVALCRAAKVPARLVTGFEIKESNDARPHTWVEVLNVDHWESYDPLNGFAVQLPNYFMPVARKGGYYPLAGGQRSDGQLCNRPPAAATGDIRPPAAPAPGHPRSEHAAHRHA